MKIKSFCSLLVVSLTITMVQPAAAQQPPQQSNEPQRSIQKALTGPHRSEANKARDVYRHPAETLAFFGLEPNMTVVEIWPGRGWYTEILAAVLKNRGQLYAAHFSPDMEGRFYQKMLNDFEEKLRSDPSTYGGITLTALTPPQNIDIAPKASADLVLTFRNVHNWMVKGEELNVFKAIFKALKPGGILGVVEHRANPAAEHDPEARSGYVGENYVISVAERAGFVLVDKSEINANLKDTRDHPKGVWTLPPRLILGDDHRDKYLAIGESDRMTLKFLKPRALPKKSPIPPPE